MPAQTTSSPNPFELGELIASMKADTLRSRGTVLMWIKLGLRI
jgi:hypothetical protein